MTTNSTNTKKNNIWYLIHDEDTKITMAQKKVDGTIITVPATTEILKTIKKQIEANENAKKIFRKVGIDNENIIAYLYLLLDQYVNFLESDNLEYLINLMKQLETSTFVDKANASFINRLRESYQSDIEIFYDTLEQFRNYNLEYFSKFNNIEQAAKAH